MHSLTLTLIHVIIELTNKSRAPVYVHSKYQVVIFDGFDHGSAIEVTVSLYVPVTTESCSRLCHQQDIYKYWSSLDTSFLHLSM